jgi:predicted dehydrogenase
MSKISWGVISTAKIGTEKVIPAMQHGKYTEVMAIASRNIETAKSTAAKLKIAKAYGSYEELLTDKDIDAIYIPLPNHLHVEWILKSLQAGKHVLCEKPITMNYQDAVALHNDIKKFPDLKVMEAFMYRHHPHIQHTKEMIRQGAIGEIRNMHSVFSYYNVDPNNIRNMANIGGGGLLDIGCYCISISRFMFDEEPLRVSGTIDFDPEFKTDRLAAAVMEFKKGSATFCCSTQMADHKHALIFGTEGKIELTNPFSTQADEKAIIKRTTKENKIEKTEFEAVDQYTLQGDFFSKAILDNTKVPTPFEDAVANMKVIDAVFESAKKGTFINI